MDEDVGVDYKRFDAFGVFRGSQPILGAAHGLIITHPVNFGPSLLSSPLVRKYMSRPSQGMFSLRRTHFQVCFSRSRWDMPQLSKAMVRFLSLACPAVFSWSSGAGSGRCRQSVAGGPTSRRSIFPRRHLRVPHAASNIRAGSPAAAFFRAFIQDFQRLFSIVRKKTDSLPWTAR
jgi:hypothetical protein